MSNRILRIAKNFITDPLMRWAYLGKYGVLNFINDKTYLKMTYKRRVGGKLDLDNPTTCCEKLNWLKLYNRRPEYTMMVDKYEVKKYVAEKIGEEHVTPLYGVWNKFDDIDFDILPDSFVLKCAHDGGPVVVKDKSKMNKDELRKIFKKKQKINYFWQSREWPYKNVKPRIIAEKYIPSLGHKDSVEYKLTCCNGEVKFVTVCTGIAHAAYEDRKNDHFDKDWNQLHWYAYYESSGKEIPRPKEADDLIRFAEILAKDIPYVRVDFYVADGNIIFGEMTFFTWGGFIKFEPPEWDKKIGDMITLPEKYTEK